MREVLMSYIYYYCAKIMFCVGLSDCLLAEDSQNVALGISNFHCLLVISLLCNHDFTKYLFSGEVANLPLRV